VTAHKGHLTLLLQTLRAREGIEPLIRRGLDIAQIADLMSEAKTAGFTTIRDGAPVLTDAGLAFLGASLRRQEPGSGGWIRPLEEHRIARIDPGEPYLPDSPPESHT
jgi:hypothetical protein